MNDEQVLENKTEKTMEPQLSSEDEENVISKISSKKFSDKQSHKSSKNMAPNNKNL